MHNLNIIKSILNEQKSYLANTYGIQQIGIFGSYVRGENDTSSDLDILIELERPAKISLIGIVELEEYLSKLLGVKVDLAIKKNLRKRIEKRILSEVQYL